MAASAAATHTARQEAVRGVLPPAWFPLGWAAAFAAAVAAVRALVPDGARAHKAAGGLARWLAPGKVPVLDSHTSPIVSQRVATAFFVAFVILIVPALSSGDQLRSRLSGLVCTIYVMAGSMHLLTAFGGDVVMDARCDGAPFSLLQQFEWCFTTPILIILLRALHAYVLPGSTEQRAQFLRTLVCDEVMIVAGIMVMFVPAPYHWLPFLVSYLCFAVVMFDSYTLCSSICNSAHAHLVGGKTGFLVTSIIGCCVWNTFGVVSLARLMGWCSPARSEDWFAVCDIAAKIMYSGVLLNTTLIASETAVSSDIRAIDELSTLQQRFFFSVTHELRTPLNAVIGYTNLVAESGELNELHESFIRSALTSAEALLGLINNLLDFAKFQAAEAGAKSEIRLDSESFSLERLINDLVDITASASQKSKELTFRLAKPSAMHEALTGDYFRLRQCLVNVIDNAVKYSDVDHGKVHVEMALDGESKDVSLLTVAVEDNGVGVPEEKLKNLFQPFYQPTDGPERRGGTGLGLVITKSIITAMGGSVDFASTMGKGSVVTIKVPLTTSTTAADGGSRNQAPSRIWKKQGSTRARVPAKARFVLCTEYAELRKNLATMLAAAGGEPGVNWIELNAHEDIGSNIKAARRADPESLVIVIMDAKDGLKTNVPDGVTKVLAGFSHELVRVKELMYDEDGHEVANVLLLKKPFKPDDFNTLLRNIENRIESQMADRPQDGEDTRLGDRRSSMDKSTTNSDGSHGSADAAGGDACGMRVLVVEDKPMNLKLAQHTIASIGATVITAENGQEAVDRVKQLDEGDCFDLIYMDLMMPIMDGVQATEAIRELEAQGLVGRHTIIGLSANVGAEYIQMIRKAGMDGSFPKPFVPESLREITRQVYVRQYKGFSGLSSSSLS